jgi:hypothetical protein
VSPADPPKDLGLAETEGDRRNYFNYFTEVEEAFVRRRGTHMIVSPLDWALIEAWKDAGIPLRVVLRGIEQAFDSWDSRPHRGQRVSTLMYCKQAIDECYAAHMQSQVGAPRDDAATADVDDPFPIDGIRYSLAQAVQKLDAALVLAQDSEALAESFERARARLADLVEAAHSTTRVDTEALEADLTAVDELLKRALMEQAPEAERKAALEAAKADMKPYRKMVEKAMFQQMVEKLTVQALRERYRLPRLSLFFM